MTKTTLAALVACLLLALQPPVHALGGDPFDVTIHRGPVLGALDRCSTGNVALCMPPLPVTLGGSCSVSGPAGSECGFVCGGWEHLHVRGRDQWGQSSWIGAQADCGGASAACQGRSACTAHSPSEVQDAGTHQGRCVLLWSDTHASCSSGAAAIPPDSPVGAQFTWTSGSGGTLSWGPPLDDGGEPVTGYTVYLRKTPTPVGATAGTSFPLAGLDPDRPSEYRVTASNRAGEGPALWVGILGNTACYTTEYSCSLHCVPGALLRVYAYDAVGQLQGNPLSASVSCGTASASCTGTDSCQAVSAPNGAGTDAMGYCSALAANTYAACGAGNVPVMPGPPVGFQAQFIPNCPQSWDPPYCVRLTWSPPIWNGGAPVEEYRVYRENYYFGISRNGGSPGEWPYWTCGATCILDITGCNNGDRYWAVAQRSYNVEGPPSNIATVNC